MNDIWDVARAVTAFVGLCIIIYLIYRAVAGEYSDENEAVSPVVTSTAKPKRSNNSASGKQTAVVATPKRRRNDKS